MRPLRRAGSVRSYDSAGITEARIAAALRSGGYGIPAVSRIIDEVRAHGDTAQVQRILAERLADLTRRSVALLAAAGDVHALLTERLAEEEGSSLTSAPGSAPGPRGSADSRRGGR
ncbi:MerR family transcriptional regulator [Microbacterium oxydans]|uniref:hypothetical protein n=1 Tax=Microbacterium oxydans TaxID=82380 RepID=UPI00366DAC2E